MLRKWRPIQNHFYFGDCKSSSIRFDPLTLMACRNFCATCCTLASNLLVRRRMITLLKKSKLELCWGHYEPHFLNLTFLITLFCGVDLSLLSWGKAAHLGAQYLKNINAEIISIYNVDVSLALKWNDNVIFCIHICPRQSKSALMKIIDNLIITWS